MTETRVSMRLGRYAWRRCLIAAPFVLIAAATVAVRMYACQAPLWFDEAYPITLSQRIGHLSDIIFVQHDDNRHHLIAFWDWMVGAAAPYWVYRIPSLLAGLALPALLYFAIEPRHGKRVAALAAFLAFSSYHLLELSCEARGYSLAMAFSAAGYLCCERFLRTRRPWTAPLFAACCILGFLSHLTFLYAYVGFVLWSAWEWRRQAWRNWAIEMLTLHGPVAAAMIWLYVVDLRFLYYANGPHYTLHTLLMQFMQLTFNIPQFGRDAMALAIAVLIAAGFARVCWRSGGDWPLYLGVVATTAWAIHHRFQFNVAARHLVVGAPFLMVLLAAALDAALGFKYLRPLAIAVVLLFAAGGVRIGAMNFYPPAIGYAGAVRYMADHSTVADGAILCGDDDATDRLLLLFYARRGGIACPGYRQSPPPPWWIVPLSSPHPPVLSRDGHTYRSLRTYPIGGMAGGWDLYQLAPDKSFTAPSATSFPAAGSFRIAR